MADKKTFLAVAAIAIVIVAAAAVLLTNKDTPADDTGLKDFAGQEIMTVENLDNGVIAVGQDSFRWATYFGIADKCVMIDQNDMTNYLGKAFMYHGRATVDIEGGDSAKLTGDDAARKYFTHTNCGITMDDVRTIIELNPSIMIVPESFYTEYRNEMKAIESEGINTVTIGYIYTFLDKDMKITDKLEQNIDVLSKALNMEPRGKELKNAFSSIVEDLQDLSSKVKTKRTAYIGSVAYNGPHGMSSSLRYYLPFELAGVTNIIAGEAEYVESGVKEYSVATIASGIQNDTILFVDASGYSVNTDNTSKGIIEMFAGHDAYLIAPYIWTGINYENVFIDAYQILRYAYGDDIITEEQLEKKINDVYDKFFGTHESNRNISEFSKYTVTLPEKGTSIFEDMNAMYMVAKGNPIYGKLTANSDGTLSF